MHNSINTRSPGKVIANIDDINLGWLNAVLSGRDALTAGGATGFDTELQESRNANIVRISIQYDQRAQGRLPRSLILKLCRSAEEFISDSEVNYYVRDYAGLKDAPVVVCYDAQFSADLGCYHILMEDLSQTHEKDTRPSLEYGISIARALARLHLRGWGEERIKEIGEQLPSETSLGRYVDYMSAGVPLMLEAIANEMSDGRKQKLVEIFSQLPARLLLRIRDPVGFCVVHGDLNPGNILYPKNGVGQVYFLDRQPFVWSLTTWLGVGDLAVMMVPYWNESARRQLEVPILQAYHQSLIEEGVDQYSWDQLFADYRLCGLQMFYMAAQWCISDQERESMRWLWWLELENAMHFFHDHGCQSLWHDCAEGNSEI